MLLPVGTYTVTVTAHGYRPSGSERRRSRRTQTTTSDSTSTPVPVLEHSLTTLYDENGNGKVEPGESFQIDERLVNTGLRRRATASRRDALLDHARHHDHAGELRLPGHHCGRRRARTRRRFAGVGVERARVRHADPASPGRDDAQGPSIDVDFTVQGGPPCYGVTSRPASRSSRASTDLGNHCDDCITTAHAAVPDHALRPERTPTATRRARTGTSSSATRQHGVHQQLPADDARSRPRSSSTGTTS